MITLSLPPSEASWFFVYKDCRFGPINPIGAQDWQVTPAFLDADSLTQKRGAYNENFVTHNKFSGQVFFDPFTADTVASPTITYPNQIKWYIQGLNGVKTSTNVGCGAYVQRSARMYKTGPTVGWHHLAYEYAFPNVTVWDVYAQPTSTPGIIGYGYSKYSMQIRLDKLKSYDAASRRYYFYIDETSDVLGWNLEKSRPSYGAQTGLDWMDALRSYDEIVSLVERAMGEATSSMTSNNFVLCNKSWSPISGPTGSFETFLNTNVLPQLTWEKKKLFPLGSTDYGELVLQASQGFLANRTNMLEFLKDIRNPQEMIPKLKNLKSLKGLADNYLTAHYGLLPTISDLQNIWNAITRLNTHRDKYGYRTCSSGSRASGVWDDKPFTIEQHAKIAICDGDTGFLGLLDGLDSAGFLPTLENLWDLVPYSFLVDWFVNVGNFLERVDTRLRLERYDIRYVTLSCKQSCTAVLTASPESPYYGSVVRSLYQRWTPDQCPRPPLSPQSPTPSGHWLEGAALLIQRASK